MRSSGTTTRGKRALRALVPLVLLLQAAWPGVFVGRALGQPASALAEAALSTFYAIPAPSVRETSSPRWTGPACCSVPAPSPR